MEAEEAAPVAVDMDLELEAPEEVAELMSLEESTLARVLEEMEVGGDGMDKPGAFLSTCRVLRPSPSPPPPPGPASLEGSVQCRSMTHAPPFELERCTIQTKDGCTC